MGELELELGKELAGEGAIEFAFVLASRARPVNEA